MSIDKFGRAVSSDGHQPSHSKPLSFGYVLTSDGNIDMQKKRICNLAKPLNPEDAVTKEFVDETFNGLKVQLRKNVYSLEKKIEPLVALLNRLSSSDDTATVNKPLSSESNIVKPDTVKHVDEQSNKKKPRTS